MVVGRVVKTIYVKTGLPPPVPVGISFIDPANFTMPYLPPGVKEFEYETFEDLQLHPTGNIADQVLELQKNIGKPNNRTLNIMLGIGTGIALIVIFFVIFLKWPAIKAWYHRFWVPKVSSYNGKARVSVTPFEQIPLEQTAPSAPGRMELVYLKDPEYAQPHDAIQGEATYASVYPGRELQILKESTRTERESKGSTVTALATTSI